MKGEGGQIDAPPPSPHKKLPSKSPALSLLGLTKYLNVFKYLINVIGI